jgi:glycosyltransferase involved in cell wall biosynthesis
VSKRICVLTSHIPFAAGGHLVITEELVTQLQKHGYKAELIKTAQHPFGKQLSAYFANLSLNLTETGDGQPVDGIISTRYPSFAVKHPRHSCWLNHRMREYYDLWPIFSGRLSKKGKLKESFKRFVFHKIDEYCLEHRVKKLYAQSQTIRTRLSTWGGHPAEVLYPPAVERPYFTENYGNYIFAVSRIIDHKRIDFLVRAAAYKRVPLKIAGDGPDVGLIKDLIKELKAERYIELLGRISDEELLAQYANCRAVAFPAFNEDFGMVTMEAFSSGKAVITLNDSGGPAEIVEDEQSGFICEPKVEQYGHALNMLIEDREMAERMGKRGLAFTKDHTWSYVIEKLVEW